MKASPDQGSLADRLARLICAEGPIPVSRYMAEANATYYGSRDPLGEAGDFTTAPEISQMFGELVGLWHADLWSRAGRPNTVRYVELGPGRGTLAADALRAMSKAGLRPDVHLVETSPVLREKQAGAVPGARWHDDLSSLPLDAPLLIVANEFFDALPARQLMATETGWRERYVAHRDGAFVPVPGPAVPESIIPRHLRRGPPGTIIESSSAAAAVVRQIAHSLSTCGGAALIMDYGHERTSAGDTLQAVARHVFADPWSNPGERDLTVHVDFEALAAAAPPLRPFGPRTQGSWLEAMGIGLRARSLAEAAPGRAHDIEAARRRLTAPGEMGDLFKVLALVAPHWPDPAGFQ